MSEMNITLEENGRTFKGTLYRQNFQPSKTQTVESVCSLFASETLKVLNITDRGDHVRVQTTQYLEEKGLWNKINGKIKDTGGKWISAEKESHWEIPKER